MVKRITIKEIAKEVGVSIATVSYVLNGRNDQKISEPTKRKILQYANLYHYHGNAAARSLASGKTNSIAIYFPPALSLLSEANQAIIEKRLVKAFSKIKCRVFLLTDDDLSPFSEADAIIAMGLDESLFRKIATNNLAPIVSVDSIIGDPLFNEIVDDYESINSKPTLISLPLHSRSYREYLSKTFTLYETTSSKDACAYAETLPSSSLYVRDPALERLFASSCLPCRVVDGLSDNKVKEIVSLFEAVRSETPPTARQIAIKAS